MARLAVRGEAPQSAIELQERIVAKQRALKPGVASKISEFGGEARSRPPPHRAPQGQLATLTVSGVTSAVPFQFL